MGASCSLSSRPCHTDVASSSLSAAGHYSLALLQPNSTWPVQPHSSLSRLQCYLTPPSPARNEEGHIIGSRGQGKGDERNRNRPRLHGLVRKRSAVRVEAKDQMGTSSGKKRVSAVIAPVIDLQRPVSIWVHVLTGADDASTLLAKCPHASFALFVKLNDAQVFSLSTCREDVSVPLFVAYTVTPRNDLNRDDRATNSHLLVHVDRTVFTLLVYSTNQIESNARLSNPKTTPYRLVVKDQKDLWLLTSMCSIVIPRIRDFFLEATRYPFFGHDKININNLDVLSNSCSSSTNKPNADHFSSWMEDAPPVLLHFDSKQESSFKLLINPQGKDPKARQFCARIDWQCKMPRIICANFGILVSEKKEQCHSLACWVSRCCATQSNFVGNHQQLCLQLISTVLPHKSTNKACRHCICSSVDFLDALSLPASPTVSQLKLDPLLDPSFLCQYICEYAVHFAGARIVNSSSTQSQLTASTPHRLRVSSNESDMQQSLGEASKHFEVLLRVLESCSMFICSKSLQTAHRHGWFASIAVSLIEVLCLHPLQKKLVTLILGIFCVLTQEDGCYCLQRAMVSHSKRHPLCQGVLLLHIFLSNCSMNCVYVASATMTGLLTQLLASHSFVCMHLFHGLPLELHANRTSLMSNTLESSRSKKAVSLTKSPPPHSVSLGGELNRSLSLRHFQHCKSEGNAVFMQNSDPAANASSRLSITLHVAEQHGVRARAHSEQEASDSRNISTNKGKEKEKDNNVFCGIRAMRSVSFGTGNHRTETKSNHGQSTSMRVHHLEHSPRSQSTKLVYSPSPPPATSRLVESSLFSTMNEDTNVSSTSTKQIVIPKLKLSLALDAHQNATSSLQLTSMRHTRRAKRQSDAFFLNPSICSSPDAQLQASGTSLLGKDPFEPSQAPPFFLEIESDSHAKETLNNIRDMAVGAGESFVSSQLAFILWHRNRMQDEDIDIMGWFTFNEPTNFHRWPSLPAQTQHQSRKSLLSHTSLSTLSMPRAQSGDSLRQDAPCHLVSSTNELLNPSDSKLLHSANLILLAIQQIVKLTKCSKAKAKCFERVESHLRQYTLVHTPSFPACSQPGVCLAPFWMRLTPNQSSFHHDLLATTLRYCAYSNDVSSHPCTRSLWNWKAASLISVPLIGTRPLCISSCLRFSSLAVSLTPPKLFNACVQQPDNLNLVSSETPGKMVSQLVASGDKDLFYKNAKENISQRIDELARLTCVYSEQNYEELASVLVQLTNTLRELRCYTFAKRCPAGFGPSHSSDLELNVGSGVVSNCICSASICLLIHFCSFTLVMLHYQLAKIYRYCTEEARFTLSSPLYLSLTAEYVKNLPPLLESLRLGCFVALISLWIEVCTHQPGNYVDRLVLRILSQPSEMSSSIELNKDFGDVNQEAEQPRSFACLSLLQFVHTHASLLFSSSMTSYSLFVPHQIVAFQMSSQMDNSGRSHRQSVATTLLQASSVTKVNQAASRDFSAHQHSSTATASTSADDDSVKYPISNYPVVGEARTLLPCFYRAIIWLVQRALKPERSVSSISYQDRPRTQLNPLQHQTISPRHKFGNVDVEGFQLTNGVSDSGISSRFSQSDNQEDSISENQSESLMSTVGQMESTTALTDLRAVMRKGSVQNAHWLFSSLHELLNPENGWLILYVKSVSSLEYDSGSDDILDDDVGDGRESIDSSPRSQSRARTARGDDPKVNTITTRERMQSDQLVVRAFCLLVRDLCSMNTPRTCPSLDSKTFCTALVRFHYISFVRLYNGLNAADVVSASLCTMHIDALRALALVPSLQQKSNCQLFDHLQPLEKRRSSLDYNKQHRDYVSSYLYRLKLLPFLAHELSGEHEAFVSRSWAQLQQSNSTISNAPWLMHNSFTVSDSVVTPQSDGVIRTADNLETCQLNSVELSPSQLLSTSNSVVLPLSADLSSLPPTLDLKNSFALNLPVSPKLQLLNGIQHRRTSSTPIQTSAVFNALISETLACVDAMHPSLDVAAPFCSLSEPSNTNRIPTVHISGAKYAEDTMDQEGSPIRRSLDDVVYAHSSLKSAEVGDTTDFEVKESQYGLTPHFQKSLSTQMHDPSHERLSDSHGKRKSLSFSQGDFQFEYEPSEISSNVQSTTSMQLQLRLQLPVTHINDNSDAETHSREASIAHLSSSHLLLEQEHQDDDLSYEASELSVAAQQHHTVLKLSIPLHQLQLPSPSKDLETIMNSTNHPVSSLTDQDRHTPPRYTMHDVDDLWEYEASQLSVQKDDHKPPGFALALNMLASNGDCTNKGSTSTSWIEGGAIHTHNVGCTPVSSVTALQRDWNGVSDHAVSVPFLQAASSQNGIECLIPGLTDHSDNETIAPAVADTSWKVSLDVDGAPQNLEFSSIVTPTVNVNHPDRLESMHAGHVPPSSRALSMHTMIEQKPNSSTPTKTTQHALVTSATSNQPAVLVSPPRLPKRELRLQPRARALSTGFSLAPLVADSESRPLMDIRLQRAHSKSVSFKANSASEFYTRLRHQRALYDHSDLHVAFLRLVLACCIDVDGCSLNPLYCDRSVTVASQKIHSEATLLSILHSHLNHVQNSHVFDLVSELEMQIVASPRTRLLRLLKEKPQLPLMYQGISTRQVGNGQFAQVFVSQIPQAHHPVAIKQIDGSSSVHQRVVPHDLFSEVCVMQKLLGQEGASQLIDYGVSKGQYYIVMKAAQMSLKSWRNDLMKEKGAALPRLLDVSNSLQNVVSPCYNEVQLALLLWVFKKVLIAMRSLTQAGIVHFDIKCDNVLVDFQDEDPHQWSLYLTDFGESVTSNNGLPTSLISRGTENIQSPEMLMLTQSMDNEHHAFDRRRRNALPDAMSDVWSIGCLFYELLTNRFLFEASHGIPIVVKVNAVAHKPLLSDEHKALIGYWHGAPNKPIEKFLCAVLVHDKSRRPSMNVVEELYDTMVKQLFPSGLVEKIQSSMHEIAAPLAVVPTSVSFSSLAYSREPFTRQAAHPTPKLVEHGAEMKPNPTHSNISDTIQTMGHSAKECYQWFHSNSNLKQSHQSISRILTMTEYVQDSWILPVNHITPNVSVSARHKAAAHWETKRLFGDSGFSHTHFVYLASEEIKPNQFNDDTFYVHVPKTKFDSRQSALLDAHQIDACLSWIRTALSNTGTVLFCVDAESDSSIGENEKCTLLGFVCAHLMFLYALELVDAAALVESKIRWPSATSTIPIPQENDITPSPRYSSNPRARLQLSTETSVSMHASSPAHKIQSLINSNTSSPHWAHKIAKGLHIWREKSALAFHRICDMSKSVNMKTIVDTPTSTTYRCLCGSCQVHIACLLSPTTCMCEQEPFPASCPCQPLDCAWHLARLQSLYINPFACSIASPSSAFCWVTITPANACSTQLACHIEQLRLFDWPGKNTKDENCTMALYQCRTCAYPLISVPIEHPSDSMGETLMLEQHGASKLLIANGRSVSFIYLLSNLTNTNAKYSSSTASCQDLRPLLVKM